MSILSGFFKTKRYRKTTDGYKLESNWTSGNTVELDDGNTVQNNLGAIKGITTSTSVTEEGYAADATTVTALNNSLDGKLTNDYNGNTNTGKGIKFGKNADGSFFTLRPYLPDNILQVTKNDSTSLFSIDTFGNGSLGNNQIITSGNISSQSVNYANSSGSASAATKAYQDGNGANIASTYLKGTQMNGAFKNRPSVNIDGNICGLVSTYKQNSQGYPVVGLYIQPGTERLIIDWYADGNIIKSYIVTARA